MKDFSPLAITSAVVGFPARLVIVTRRDGTIIRIAESDEAITVDGDTFDVIPGIQVSAVKHTNNGEMPSCQVVAVHQAGAIFDTVDIDIGLFDGATVQIYIVDRLNLTRKGLLFTGSIGNTSYSIENQVVFDVKGPAQSARILMTQKRAPMCRTDLYSVLCGVDKTAYDTATTIAAFTDAFDFTITGALTQADGYFNQGTIVTADGTGFVIAKWVLATQTLTTYLPTNRLLAVGQAITIYPGCDKTLNGTQGCSFFSNQLNFQAEPHYMGVAAASQQV